MKLTMIAGLLVAVSACARAPEPAPMTVAPPAQPVFDSMSK